MAKRESYEAIKVLYWGLNRLQGAEYIVDEYGTVDNSAKERAFDMAIEALEKQIPKKPVDNHHCPNCGSGLATEHITQEEYKEICRACFNPKYCSECGQAIDWSDEE